MNHFFRKVPSQFSAIIHPNACVCPSLTRQTSQPRREMRIRDQRHHHTTTARVEERRVKKEVKTKRLREVAKTAPPTASSPSLNAAWTFGSRLYQFTSPYRGNRSCSMGLPTRHSFKTITSQFAPSHRDFASVIPLAKLTQAEIRNPNGERPC
jgi:hypothetical protein